MKIILYSLLLFLCVSFSHPIHISLTNIDFDEDENSFVIAVKIFKDDFQTVISKKYNIEYKVDEELNSQTKTYVNKYFNENFIFYINNKKVDNNDLSFIKKETNFEAIWLYYKLNNIKDLKNIKLRSSFLDDLYPDQKNLVILNYKDINKGFKFSKNDNIAEVNI